MKTSELFRKTLKEYLDKQGHGAQARLADDLRIDRRYLNGFLNGRKMLSESKREEIAEKLGYSYIDFLILGRNDEYMAESESDAIEFALTQAILIFEESVITMFGKETSIRLPYKVKAETIINIYNSFAMRLFDLSKNINIDKLIDALKSYDNGHNADEDFDPYEKASNISSIYMDSIYIGTDRITKKTIDITKYFKRAA